jgi:hypothetical protein
MSRGVFIGSAKDGFLPRTSWIWMDDSGAYFLPVKYGRNPIPIELKKGMFAIQCEGIQHAAEVLGTVRAMVLHGDFDDQLSKASAEIRVKFEKK